jgi:hypothetical protein
VGWELVGSGLDPGVFSLEEADIRILINIDKIPDCGSEPRNAESDLVPE